MSNENDNGCALVVPICEAGRLEAQRDEIAQTLEDLAADLRALQGKLRTGEVKKQDIGVAAADLRYWLKALRETEAELDTLRRKDSEVVGAYGIDLETARFEIGCRLDRLKACCREE